MSVLVAAALAAAAAAVLVALPSDGRLRLRELAHQPALRRGRSWPWHWPWSAAAAVPLALVVGLLPAVLAAAAAAAVLGRRRVRAARLADADERASAVEACGVLAGELSAGRAPAEALAAAAEVGRGPVGRRLAAAAAAARLGGDVPAALVDAVEPSAVAPVLRSLAACWSVCATTGGGLAAAVRRLEEGLRADQAHRRAVAAELAGPRATATMLAVLPGFGLLMAAGLGADPLHVLLSTPVGGVCLVLGLGLDALGLLWIDRLVVRAGGS